MNEKLYEVTNGLWIGATLHPAGTRIEDGVGTPEQMAAWLSSGAIVPVNVEPPAPIKAAEPKTIRASRGAQMPAAADSKNEVSE